MEEVRLALAAERSSTDPLLRRLGAPTGTRSAKNRMVLVESWDTDSPVLAVRRPDRRLAGWIELAGGGTGGAVFIDGRAVVDAADSVPWLAGVAGLVEDAVAVQVLARHAGGGVEVDCPSRQPRRVNDPPAPTGTPCPATGVPGGPPRQARWAARRKVP
ncbi:hypothetical protein ACFV1W_39400 [Kitasatospora sp. NPDC059648]|uniref:hypothetical protein n=1 Tax=Kitasatospora sp. NPDC059648 TaxID=3346894 RepID=UPI00367865A1